MEPNDAEIMRQVQAGRLDMFEVLVRRYRPALMQVARNRLGDPAWAEDVVQETFLAAFTARDQYKPAFAFRTWLWTILLNLCRRQWRRRQTGPRSAVSTQFTGQPHEPAFLETGLSVALAVEQRERVRTLLTRLPEVQGDAIRLRFFGGLPFAEIAATMNSSLAAAKDRVKTGLLTLAKWLQEESAEERPHDL